MTAFNGVHLSQFSVLVLLGSPVWNIPLILSFMAGHSLEAFLEHVVFVVF